MGGDNISVTRGVVSRIDTMPYTQGAEDLLVIQIDAAINPGNSGGPVFDTSGHVIGAAFSGLVHASNIGFIIPTVTIDHFLAQFNKNGKYVGVLTANVGRVTYAGYADVTNAAVAGANVNTDTFHGLTPITIAAQHNHVGVVEALISAGANLNQASGKAPTPLRAATFSGLYTL